MEKGYMSGLIKINM